MTDKCQQCEKNDGNGDHTCPYASEINDDHETLCNCCEACTYECCMEI